MSHYPALEEVLWVQEEPENMGAWEFVRPYFDRAIPAHLRLRVVSRPSSSSPAEGSNNLHAFNQKRLIEQAFEPLPTRPSPEEGAVDKEEKLSNREAREKARKEARKEF